MARKIVPSLYHLRGKDLLPERFHVIGFSRRDWDDDALRAHVRAILAEKYSSADPADVEAFLGLFTYQRGSFEDSEAYAAVGRETAAIDAAWGTCANKLFYLAVPPEHYATIFERLSASGLTDGCSPLEGWTRVLVEKPFGSDAHTSSALDELLGSLFREEQIYRIDHYLAKEMLQGIVNFRFTNNLFETAWDRTAIERIDISLLETLGVEKRGAFYDGVGALRDVGQNHLLQMLALVTMEQPQDSGPASIRQARAELLRSLRPLRLDEIATQTYRSQYRGFRDIAGVSPESETETYFKLRMTMAGRRWAGVPVTMESGKHIGGAARKEIRVTLRHPHPCICEVGRHHQNEIVFTLEPTDSIEIVFWAKRPGFEQDTERRTFNFFLYEKTEKAQYVEEYARLLHDAIRGDQTLFVSTDEVRAMWAFIDPIQDAWHEGTVPLGSYEPDTDEALHAADEALSASARRGSVGVVGLGKMGAGLARNALSRGWDVVGFNRTTSVAHAMAAEGLTPADTLEGLVAALEPPRAVWLMVPAGKPVDDMLFGVDDRGGALADLLAPGDLVVDGGNSFYRDSLERSSRLAERGIGFLDVGTSGGPGGARAGACLMIGGDRELFERLEPLFADVSVPGGYRFFEGVGAGHFVKMIHNGIEYGMMQAIAEGFQMLHLGPFDLDLEQVADVYQHGSVVESRLLEWLVDAFAQHGDDLADVSGSVGHTGEGEWTVKTAEELGLEARVISDALRFRIESERNASYAGQVLTALRDQFGGHGLGR